MPSFVSPRSQPPSGPGIVAGQPFIGVPVMYFNGFVLNLAASDISLMALLDGQPQMRLSMSFTTAKTLSGLLAELVDKLEAATGREIMKADEVNAGLQKIDSGET